MIKEQLPEIGRIYKTERGYDSTFEVVAIYKEELVVGYVRDSRGDRYIDNLTLYSFWKTYGADDSLVD